MFYNGNAEYEPGAIVMRVTPSFLRFGNFEMPSVRKETTNLKKLVDWTISKYYPHIEGEDKVLQWYTEVVQRTAALMTEWQRVGFVHGVMNTDNMSILGLTIDYGPYSFVDDYDPDFTPNTTDLPGRRYAFGKQPAVAKWNLACLAGAVAPVISDTEKLTEALHSYDDFYWEKYYGMISNKLGLDEVKSRDTKLVSQLEQTLRTVKPDMTIFYQLLIDLDRTSEQSEAAIANHFQKSFYGDLNDQQIRQLYNFVSRYKQRLEGNSISTEESIERMRQANPRFILRNYLLHQAIEKLENGDREMFEKLMSAMKEPYSTANNEYFAKRPEWATQKAGCSMLSCSS